MRLSSPTWTRSINLAGTPIRPRPFTSGYKAQLTDSRIDSTATISEALADAATADPDRKRVLLSASAVGYYGDTGSRAVTEKDPAGATSWRNCARSGRRRPRRPRPQGFGSSTCGRVSSSTTEPC